MKTLKIAALGFGLMAAPAFADGHATGDAAVGEKLYSKCKACHSIVDDAGEVILKGGRNGPNLFGLHTRVAGAQEAFVKKYGKSLVEAGENGLAWDEGNFVTYVADPRAFLREYNDDKRARSKMSFKLGKEQDAKDIWAYIVSVGPAS